MFYASSGQVLASNSIKSLESKEFSLLYWEGSLRIGFKVVPKGSGKALRKLSDKATAEDERMRVEVLQKLIWAYSRRYEKLLEIGAGKMAGRESLAEISSEVRKVTL